MLGTYYSHCVDSPVGELQLLASEKGLSGVYFNGRGLHEEALSSGAARDGAQFALLLKTQRQLSEYFMGTRRAFDLPLDVRGTVFQLKVWQVLRGIEYGQTISYGEQARRMGDSNKARAVGAANGRNPVSIIVPCHRVVGSSGKLVGFGGGLKTKAFLLELEVKACRAAA